eukprot:TRINITY_DN2662_c0_g1_i1.p1 TRINITY_DN2662_c0_g1~~TRINITY_DN2662_c0_g1_i1.p1  ORF type:complete len:802 (+),score=245.02 TRINITY_DN2662_c0_g1_i1:158-2563(+)
MAGTPKRKAIKLQRGGCNPGSKEMRFQVSQSRMKQNREAVLQARRIGRQGAPKIVGFLPVGDTSDQRSVRRDIERHCGVAPIADSGPRHVQLARERQTFTLVSAPDDYQHQLDVAKIADVLVLVLRVHDEQANAPGTVVEPDLPDDQSVTTAQTWYSDIGLCIDDEGRELLNTLSAQGVPSLCVVLQGLQSIPNAKRRKHLARVHLRYFQSIFTAEQVPRVFTTDLPETTGQMVRYVCESRVRPITWREARPYFLVDDCRWADEAAPEAGTDGKPAKRLQVCGFLRGKPLAANQLVHLTGFGTYQIEAIHCADPGLPPTVGECIARPDDEQESLQYCNAPDPLSGEQTWPTAEEMRMADEKARREKELMQGGVMKKVRVPAGFSDYQAAWVTNETDVMSDDESDAPAAEVASAAPTRVSAMSLGAQTDVEDALGGEWLASDEALSPEERQAEIAKLREASKEDRDYPDEVETPLHIPARVRFQKYRGLQSFRQSEWDVNESLPLDYARIFKFQDFRRTKKVAVAASADGDVSVDTYVCVILRAVPIGFMEAWQSRSEGVLVASALLMHEHKYTVMHFLLQRNKEYQEPIKSKTRLVLHFGFRKLVCNPLFSEPAKGTRTRFQRYFHPEDRFVLASVFAPAMYQPTPVLCFMPITKEEKEQGMDMPLVAYGSVEAPNPDLILLKKVMLTGHIYKSHKRQCIVRFMFHNEDDVKWFQPVELYTKLGFRGKITKSIGTHGHMKVQFSGIIQHHDVVCMDLWKRVFPKWTTCAFSWLAEQPQDEISAADDDEDMDGDDEGDEMME